ncbi:FAD-binding protein [Enterococcus termitis]
MMEHRCFFKRNEIYFETENLAVFAYDAFLEKNFPELVVFPKNEKEMIMVINYLKSQRLPYLIRGGATNYVGSVVPINNDIIVSTLRMEKNGN